MISWVIPLKYIRTYIHHSSIIYHSFIIYQHPSFITHSSFISIHHSSLIHLSSIIHHSWCLQLLTGSKAMQLCTAEIEGKSCRPYWSMWVAVPFWTLSFEYSLCNIYEFPCMWFEYLNWKLYVVCTLSKNCSAACSAVELSTRILRSILTSKFVSTHVQLMQLTWRFT